MSNEPISARLVAFAIEQSLDRLTIADVLKIRDKCNDIIVRHNSCFKTIPEPEEFRAWKVKHF